MPEASAWTHGVDVASRARPLELTGSTGGDNPCGTGPVRPEKAIGVELQLERGVETCAEAAADACIALHDTANRGVEPLSLLR
jgi:hypothetical protein